MLNAVFSVIFPQNLIYFDDFINSINNQSCQNFDLILINDGVDLIFFDQKKPSLKCQLKVINVPYKFSFGKIREFGIREVVKMGYDNIIFVDSDDIMSNNRVELSLNSLASYPIVFNDLSLINNKGEIYKESIWGNRLVNQIINKSFLLDKNVIGLGNSAVKTKLLNGIVIPDSIIASDWYIFSKVINDFEANFIPDCVTFYRQHNFNSIGVKDHITTERLKFICSVKEIHYLELCSLDFRFKTMLNMIKLQKKNINPKQIEYINNNNINFFWWEETNYLQL